MANNNSAILDVVVENKEISSVLYEKRHYDSLSPCGVCVIDNAVSPGLKNVSTEDDVKNLLEQNIDNSSSLAIKVDNPQKVLDTLETYITFRITTKVTRLGFTENEYIVRRRYNDFVWLREKLIDVYPFNIVPPLPAKHSIMGQLDRYSKNFVIVRMNALNEFMQRIVQHPTLNFNEHFKIFITAKQGHFSLYQKHEVNCDRKLQLLKSTVSSHSNLKIRHMEFEKSKSYLNVLYDKLVSIEKVSNRIYRERQDFVKDLNGYYPIFTRWATFEPELALLLKNIACAIEKSTIAQNNLAFSYVSILGSPIKELLSYIHVVQSVLYKREVYQNAFESSVAELNKKYNEKDKLIATSQNQLQSTANFPFFQQTNNDNKLEKLGISIPQLVKRVEADHNNLQHANECLRSDLHFWQQEKQTIIKKILLDFINRQIEYYTATVKTWEHVTNEVSKTEEDAATSSLQ